MKKLILLGLLSLFTQTAVFAKGGTVVGNGAGLVESNFQHAYAALDKVLVECVSVEACLLEAADKVTVRKILSIVRKNINTKDRLVFISERQNPGFFTTGTSEKHRIAKTGLNAEGPIYINSDLLYSYGGKPAISYQGIIRILVHELGHQTGLLDHAALDILGEKVAVLAESHTSSISMKNPADNSAIIFSITNYEAAVKSSTIRYLWKNQVAEDLTGPVYKATKCSSESESVTGLEITNGHFRYNDKKDLFFAAWINVFCYDSLSKSVYTYTRDLSIPLDSDFIVKDIIVE